MKTALAVQAGTEAHFPAPPVGVEVELVVVGELPGAVELGELGDEPMLLRMLSHLLLGKLPDTLASKLVPAMVFLT